MRYQVSISGEVVSRHGRFAAVVSVRDVGGRSGAAGDYPLPCTFASEEAGCDAIVRFVNTNFPTDQFRCVAHGSGHVAPPSIRLTSTTQTN